MKLLTPINAGVFVIGMSFGSLATTIFFSSTFPLVMPAEKQIVHIKQVEYQNDFQNWMHVMDSSHTVSKSFYFGGVFPVSIHISFVNDPKKYLNTDFLDFYPSFEIQQPSQYGNAFTTWDYQHYPNKIFIVINHNDVSDVNTKSHEMSHAVDKMMLSLGINDTEVKAYLIGYLMTRVEDVPRWDILKSEYSGTWYSTSGKTGAAIRLGGTVTTPKKFR